MMLDQMEDHDCNQDCRSEHQHSFKPSLIVFKTADYQFKQYRGDDAGNDTSPNSLPDIFHHFRTSGFF